MQVLGCSRARDIFGCSFLAYSWKLPTYSGAFLLAIDNFSFFAYNWSFFAYNNISFFLTVPSFFTYSGKVRLISALRDCKQRSLTVSKKAPTVSKKASPDIFGTPGLSPKKTTCSFSYRFRGNPGIRGLYQAIRVATWVPVWALKCRDFAHLSASVGDLSAGFAGKKRWQKRKTNQNS